MEKVVVKERTIKEIIYRFRNIQVMLDFDLADLYQVETKALNQAVKRNIERFPADFMFQLTDEEFEDLQSQNVTANISKRRTLPYVFSQNGVAMLSGVLRSKQAVEVNIQIMRVFTNIKELSSGYSKHISELYKMIREVDKKHQTNYSEIIEYLQELLDQGNSRELKRIGFVTD